MSCVCFPKTLGLPIQQNGTMDWRRSKMYLSNHPTQVYWILAWKELLYNIDPKASDDFSINYETSDQGEISEFSFKKTPIL